MIEMETGAGAETKSGAKIIARWLPTVLWVALLCIFSNAYFSANNTRQFALIFAHFLQTFHISGMNMSSLNIFLRKSAHFSLYIGFFLILVHGPLEGHPY
ncbi:MAG: hypothetical protein ACREP6_07585, partial [Candidatus Binataceae bacterium]